ncbi:LysR family transcriptional regulator [Curtobacterium sp. MCBD17_035]|uniref:LysR family transcriptional regulator n=1 Tax=Curtobacterium sp. MCBD17_035 TaxID=2175673 RepID=UPI000DAA3CD8|nr:LysR family transcriptional regulator [Curtobacterium sp. MCBD17_035]WIB66855.1 LysR family transcriptional regulator [Curtobacterium sp. MCBD17_035]
MDVTLVQLRALVALVSTGTFTDAAIDLHVSQASVSRAVQALEAALGFSLVRRTTRSLELTPQGRRVVDHARRILDEVESLRDLTPRASTEVRIGYAWSALGRHTTRFQREWAAEHLEPALSFVQSNTPTAGLAEGGVDVAILRRPVDDPRFDSAPIGTERRFAALASDDPLSRRRSVTLTDFAGRTVGIDLRTGTTTADLWAGISAPAAFRDTRHVDDWLTLVAAGQVTGMTSEATAALHARTGVTFRLVRDAPPIEVLMAWRRASAPPALAALIEKARGLLADPISGTNDRRVGGPFPLSAAGSRPPVGP